MSASHIPTIPVDGTMCSSPECYRPYLLEALMAFWGDGVEIHGQTVRDGHPMGPRPVMFVWMGREHHIDHVSACWRIHTEW
jgi:hypothetical protein